MGNKTIELETLEAGKSARLGQFTGSREILIIGRGGVTIMRELGGHIYPLTDDSGEPISYENFEEDGVLLNSTLTNEFPKNTLQYYIRCDSGEIKYLVV